MRQSEAVEVSPAPLPWRPSSPLVILADDFDNHRKNGPHKKPNFFSLLSLCIIFHTAYIIIIFFFIQPKKKPPTKNARIYNHTFFIIEMR